MISSNPDVPRHWLEPLSAMQPALWQRLCDCVQTETGMDFRGVRATRLLEVVAKVLNRSGLGFADLESLLSHPGQRCRFLERLSSELTVGESYFFRNEHHFRALRESVLPEILRENGGQRELRIWSAGCAAGEEPYSLAILLDQMLGKQLESWRISILATDLNRDFLDRGRAGQYRSWSFRQTNIHQDANYFVPHADGFGLVPRIRNLVRFAYLNLVKDVYPSPSMGTIGLDLILFRNVAIYLRPDVTTAIIARFHRALRPGGWLLLGETEVTLAVTEGFQVIRLGHATLLRRTEVAPSCCPAARAPMPGLPAPALVAGSPIVGASPSRDPLLPTTAPLGARALGGSAAPAGQASGAKIDQTLEQLVVAGRDGEAEQAIQRIRDRPTRARARLAYCKSLLSCVQLARARKMLSLCLSEEPLLLEAQLLAAAFSEEAGDTKTAEQAYRRAIYIDRNCAMSHFHLGLVLDQQGKHEVARRSLQQAMALTEGKHPEAFVEFGEGICYGRLRELITMLIDR